MKIGELAKATGCTVETIRYYEAAGLLPKANRTGANYRDYGSDHLDRLKFVRNCRALDMTHEEIRGLLATMDRPADSCGSVVALLDTHIGHVETRLKELKHLKAELVELRLKCQTESTGETCGILKELQSMQTDAASDRHTHL